MTTKEMHMKISSRGFIGSTAAFAGTAAAALDVPKGSAKKAPKGAAKLPLSRMPAFAVAMAAVLAAVAVPSAAERGFVVVTDYVKADGKADVSDAIQKVIDEHPNRTIFFPDGTYLLSKSVSTPAHPEKSVDLQLSRYAVLKAAPGWTSSEAMVRLGGIHAANIVWANGSVYSLSGGIIDCSGVANGVSIDSGRDTRVKGVVIRNAAVGLRIKNGANSGSSDCEISDLDITGNGASHPHYQILRKSYRQSPRRRYGRRLYRLRKPRNADRKLRVVRNLRRRRVPCGLGRRRIYRTLL